MKAASEFLAENLVVDRIEPAVALRCSKSSLVPRGPWQCGRRNAAGASARTRALDEALHVGMAIGANPLGADGGVAVVVKKFLNVDAICSGERFEKREVHVSNALLDLSVAVLRRQRRLWWRRRSEACRVDDRVDGLESRLIGTRDRAV